MIVAAAAAALMPLYELAMQTFSELFLCGVTYCEDFAAEIEHLACHRMVEVHLHCSLCNFQYLARNYTAHRVHQRYNVSNFQKVFSHFAFHLESLHRKVYDHLFLPQAVAVLRLKCKGEAVARFLAFDVCFKERKEISHALNEVQWTLFSGFVGKFSINDELIYKLYNLFIFNFHNLFVIKYLYLHFQRPGSVSATLPVPMRRCRQP